MKLVINEILWRTLIPCSENISNPSHLWFYGEVFSAFNMALSKEIRVLDSVLQCVSTDWWYIYIYIYIYMCVCVCVYFYGCIHIYIYKFLQILLYIHNMCVYVCACVCVFVCVYTRIYIYIYIYICIYVINI